MVKKALDLGVNMTRNDTHRLGCIYQVLGGKRAFVHADPSERKERKGYRKTRSVPGDELRLPVADGLLLYYYYSS